MTAPEIVLLEDERAQLVSMRAVLRDFGRIQEFTDPEAALAYLRHHAVDVAVVDVHMPRQKMNGLELIKEVREFDRDLCIIVRTGDSSGEVADHAIEARAFRRIIKGKISVAEFQAVASAAIRETATRRKATIDAATAAEVKTHLVKTLGSVEEELAIADSYKEFFLSLRNQITAIAGMADVIQSAAANNEHQLLKTSVAANRSLAAELVAQVNAFMDGPYAEALRAARGPSRATVNGVVDAIRRRFANTPKWSVSGRGLSATGLMEDLFVSVSPIGLLSALRHLIEYCLLHSAPGSTVALTTTVVPPAQKPASSSSLGAAVRFRVSSNLDGTTLDEIKQALNGAGTNPCEGNLQMVELALSPGAPPLDIDWSYETTAFDLVIPLAR